MVKPTLTIPTGYEAEQLKAAQKRKIAQMMLEKGLNPSGNMQSWTQVLASVADAYVGKKLDKKADDIDADTRTRMMQDFTKASGDFQADAGSSTPDAMVAKYGTNPWLQDDLKPYQDAIAKRLTERENIVRTPTTYARQGDLVGKPIFDPNASMIPTGNPGEYGVNQGAVASALLKQGYGVNGGTTLHDPTMGPSGTPPAGPPSAPNGAPAAGPDMSLLSPEEKQILQNELARRAAAKSGAYQPPHPNMPMGNPLTARRAPAGVANGKPYWLINGVPYDNPEGN